ncbi:MAG: S8 family peptidase [Gemmatimonadaceae bacterium]|nr:S8 family peptidase [Gemmatimonadaceae bacterium]
MMRSIVTEPLLTHMRDDPNGSFDVIISLNEFCKDGMAGALATVEALAREWGVRYSSVSNYVFATLSAARIETLAKETQKANATKERSAVVYRIWEDSDIGVTLTRSVTTIKADAAQRSFHALGEGIVWAVLDSGIDGTHPHFASSLPMHGSIDSFAVGAPVEHRDYTPDGRAPTAAVDPATGSPPVAASRARDASALLDRLGHGSHVAGIIAGHWTAAADGGLMVVGTEVRDEGAGATVDGEVKTITSRESLKSISGVAPLCKVVSLKVIADVTRTDEFKQKQGQGKVSWVLRAIDDIQTWNQNGRRILVHGVNMSVGYSFDPRWFACGQSPICAEVNRLVRSGVVVVVSAGNDGYSSYITGDTKQMWSYNESSIMDPGNAELAITVGSTHREMPHTYGVSYFSSRGPTGDGRRKPDLLAPGERIRSCAAGREQDRYGIEHKPQVLPADEAAVDEPGTEAHAPEGGGAVATATKRAPATSAPANGKVMYCEQTGTSMAAPHVSGAAAAFLSVRTEFIGQPERVKALFLANAIDLGRESRGQGKGLLDLMKVLQAV